MNKPQVKIKLVERKGKYGCHRGHQIGDIFDFDKDRGKLCPMAMHTLFPYIDILRYGGTIPTGKEHGDIRVCCSDPDVINVFLLDVVKTP
ncbi:MAG: TIGR04076 family protein [Lachnospirales bacterium]